MRRVRAPRRIIDLKKGRMLLWYWGNMDLGTDYTAAAMEREVPLALCWSLARGLLWCYFWYYYFEVLVTCCRPDTF